MDLLNNDLNIKKQKTKKQKLVLILLIISIVLLIVSIVLIILLPKINNTTVTTKNVKINNQESNISSQFIVMASNGESYIELRELAKLLNYTYYNGGYLEFSEDKTKGYIDNEFEIIGFEQNSKQIYKTQVSQSLEYQYYELSTEILPYNNNLYINEKDLPLALNVIKEKENINTVENLAKIYEEKAKEKGYSIDTSYNNLKAIAYDLIVVSKASKKGIVNKNFGEVVGTKYSTIEFNEKEKEFIVSSNSKYGIIKSNGEIKVKLVYDDLKIISYSPVLYQIKKDGKIGLLNEEGLPIANTEYDKIGYDENKQQGILYTLIVPSMDETIGDTVVVAKQQKYGLINITNGKIVLECNVEGIYQLKEKENLRYVVKISGQTYNLTDYLKYARVDI